MVDNVIPLNIENRLLARAKALLVSPEDLFEDADGSVKLLYQALPLADEKVKLKIVLALGSLARPQVVWPLYKVMHDDDQCETVRHAAALQLSMVGGLLDQTESLVAQLREDLTHPDTTVRTNAAFALGWEGNDEAADSLKACLNDEDPEVQQAAVSALANISDEKAFRFLVEMLESGGWEQQRNILYNLYRFASRKKEVVALYRRFIHGSDSHLRYDALAMFNTVVEVDEALEDYLKCLADDQACVREIALSRLMGADTQRLKGVFHLIEPLFRDSDPKVRQTAVKLYSRVHKESNGGFVRRMEPKDV